MYPKPFRNHGAIWQIAWPMMLSSMSVPMLGLVDTALLGHLDSAKHLGAVAIGANIMGLLYWSFGFLRMSTTGLTAIAVGQTSAPENQPTQTCDKHSLDGIIGRAMLLGLALGIAIFLMAPALASLLVELMQASSTITPIALEYIEIRKFSAPAVFITFAISGWLIGQKKTSQALTLVLATNTVNIVLDVCFIFYFGWEARGAALATVCAEWLGLAIGLIFIFRNSKLFKRGTRWTSFIEMHAFNTMLTTNLHLLARTILLMLVLNFFTAQGSVHSDTILAANAILLQLILLSAYVTDGFSYAAEVLCGQAHGAGDSRKVNQTLKECMLWGVIASLVFGLVYAVIPLWIIELLTNLTDVIDASLRYLPWAIVITCVGFLAYLMDGACIGTNRSAAMNYAMCFSALIVFFPAWWVSQPMANNGLWFSFLLFTIARGFSLGGYWWFSQRKVKKRSEVLPAK